MPNKMNSEDKILTARLDDKIRLCSENSMITSSSFLDMRERSVAINHRTGFDDVRVVFYGGFEDAERTVAVMLPYFIEADSSETLHEYFTENPESCPISIIGIKKDRFSPTLSHRDYLGALMGLGIKREVTGDIKVTDDGCQIAVLSSIASFITENMSKAGRGTLQARIIPLSLIGKSENSNGTDESFTVSSMRLDSVVKNAFNLSRGSAVQAIEGGLVYVNDSECQKSDKKISEGDKIVLRKKGRIIVSDCSSTSKKGRIIVKIKKFA